jgi:type I restriction enzyme S subunit
VTFRTAALNSLGIIHTGSTPPTAVESFWGGEFPFVTPAELDQQEPIQVTHRTLTESGAKRAQVLKRDAVLVCCIGSLGKVGLAGRNLVSNQQINAIEFDENLVFPKYGFYACQRLKPKMVAMAPATTVPIVNKSKFGQLEIPLPPLPEQRRIAAILDKANALRGKRREALALLDSLAQSIFVEMFGDPVSNPKGWSVTSLSGICSIAGEYGAGLPSKEYDSCLPRYVRITDINEEGELSDKPVSPSGPPADWRGYKLQTGDILFARSGATVGKTYMYKDVDGECVFAGYLIRFRANPTVALPSYIFAFTRTAAYRSWVAARQRVVAQPNINAKQFGDELMFPLPPLSLQIEFQRIVDHLERQRCRLIKCTKVLDELFASIQYRAFRCEL